MSSSQCQFSGTASDSVMTMVSPVARDMESFQGCGAFPLVGMTNSKSLNVCLLSASRRLESSS